MPATAAFPGNSATTSLTITGVSGGTAIIHASMLPWIADTTITVTVNALGVATLSLPNGTTNVAYSQQLQAIGGTSPYTWTKTSGTLPAGLSLTTSGLISGTPTATVTNTPLTFKVTDSLSATASASLTLTINLPTGPASIAATSGTPQSASINTAFGSVLTATVKDAANNPVSNAVVTFTAPANGASGTFANGTATTTTTTNTSGVATSSTFTANSTAGANYTVAATVTGVATPANFTLTNTPGAAASITATGGTPQSAGLNSTFGSALLATVKDSGGNLVSGVTVTFAAPASGASGTFAGGAVTATTNASGVAASAAFTANTVPGSYIIAATVSGVATPANFAMTNTTVAGSITATGGTPQSASINTAFGAQFAATVKDSFNNPVSGVTVTFTAPGTGASGTFAGGIATAVTNASGVATSATFTANATVGVYTVAASVSGVGTIANFSLTNTQGTAATITATGGTPQTAHDSQYAFTNPFPRR